LLWWTGIEGASFYDNPEQDPIALVGESKEELLRKWDFEVGGF
jgi:hypothetical protein